MKKLVYWCNICIDDHKGSLDFVDEKALVGHIREKHDYDELLSHFMDNDGGPYEQQEEEEDKKL